jgi:hypothetical protein
MDDEKGESLIINELKNRRKKEIERKKWFILQSSTKNKNILLRKKDILKRM